MTSPEERRFARIALDEEYVSREQLKQCLNIQQKMADLGLEPKGLAEILIEKGYLREEQAERVRRIQADRPEGRRIANFQILKRLDKGAMGVVYKAKQLLMDRVVALKVLSDRLAKDREFKNRFIKEARAIGMLKHPNIIQGIDVGEWEGKMYFAMEYVDGHTVFQLLKRGGRLDEARALEIVRQIACALDHAHKNHLVHRDIKPDNIMVSRDGEAKLCDLGLVKHPGYSRDTEEGRSLGTPNYISPEQARGESNVDIRSDVYSLGASLYHMVVGEVPFKGAPAVVMTKHINDPFPDPLEAHPELHQTTANLILKMTAKDPADRYQAPADLLRDLAAIQKGEDPFGLGGGAAGDAPQRPPSRRLPGSRLRGVARRRRRRR